MSFSSWKRWQRLEKLSVTNPVLVIWGNFVKGVVVLLPGLVSRNSLTSYKFDLRIVGWLPATVTVDNGLVSWTGVAGCRSGSSFFFLSQISIHIKLNQSSK